MQSKVFCLTVPKTLVGNKPSVLCSRDFLATKVLKKRGKEYQEFPWKAFCPTVPKNLVGEQPFCAVFQKISGSEKFWKRRGSIKSFRGKFFVSQCRKVFWGNNPSLLCFRNFLAAKKFEKEGEGVLKVPVENVFSHSAKKFGRGSLVCCVSENF